MFVKEIHIPFTYETDIHDTYAQLFCVYDEEGTPIGAGRFRQIGNIGKVERICVSKEFRNQNVGVIIMDKIEDYAINNTEVKELQLAAQLRAFSFYKRLNYEPYGEIFFECGIDHKHMKKIIR